MKILITGAHFTPAVAVIEELKKDLNVEVVYVGRETTMEGDKSISKESQTLPSLGVKFIPIITGRLQRSFSIYTFLSLVKIPIGFLQALYIILIEKPDVILSFGGYVAVPVVIMGWFFSIPIIVHEQTLVSGLANRISSYFADKIALSFDQNRKNNSKVIITGNPIRKDILNSTSVIEPSYKNVSNIAKKHNLQLILIMGGSQGSHILNINVEKILPELTEKYCIIHITGESKYKDFERLSLLGDFDGRYLVKKWIGKNYGAILKKVDFVVSRAGANTLTELAFLEKPALVVPIPYLYQDEQNKNAIFFKNLGLVEILPQSKLSGDSLLKSIDLFLNNLNNIKKKIKDIRKILIKNAAQRLALETLLLGAKRH